MHFGILDPAADGLFVMLHGLSVLFHLSVRGRCGGVQRPLPVAFLQGGFKIRRSLPVPLFAEGQLSEPGGRARVARTDFQDPPPGIGGLPALLRLLVSQGHVGKNDGVFRVQARAFR